MPGNMPQGAQLYWGSSGKIPSTKYTCPHCGNQLASNKGWLASSRDGKPAA